MAKENLVKKLSQTALLAGALATAGTPAMTLAQDHRGPNSGVGIVYEVKFGGKKTNNYKSLNFVSGQLNALESNTYVLGGKFNDGFTRIDVPLYTTGNAQVNGLFNKDNIQYQNLTKGQKVAIGVGLVGAAAIGITLSNSGSSSNTPVVEKPAQEEPVNGDNGIGGDDGGGDSGAGNGGGQN